MDASFPSTIIIFILERLPYMFRNFPLKMLVSHFWRLACGQFGRQSHLTTHLCSAVRKDGQTIFSLQHLLASLGSLFFELNTRLLIIFYFTSSHPSS